MQDLVLHARLLCVFVSAAASCPLVAMGHGAGVSVAFTATFKQKKGRIWQALREASTPQVPPRALAPVLLWCSFLFFGLCRAPATLIPRGQQLVPRQVALAPNRRHVGNVQPVLSAIVLQDQRLIFLDRSLRGDAARRPLASGSVARDAPPTAPPRAATGPTAPPLAPGTAPAAAVVTASPAPWGARAGDDDAVLSRSTAPAPALTSCHSSSAQRARPRERKGKREAGQEEKEDKR